MIHNSAAHKNLNNEVCMARLLVNQVLPSTMCMEQYSIAFIIRKSLPIDILQYLSIDMPIDKTTSLDINAYGVMEVVSEWNAAMSKGGIRGRTEHNEVCVFALL